MPTPFQLALGVAVLVGLGVLVVFSRRLAHAFLAYRGTRVVVCPESREMAAVQVDAGHAALSAFRRRPQLHLELCTRWPERAGCGQECLGQIESAPEACLLRNILGYWYQGKSCVYCGRPFHTISWHDHEPGLVRPDGALVVVEVADRGPGLLPGDEVRVFEKFYRAQASPHGVGLGLAICRGIVEAHGGTISVKSSLGKGSTFAFALKRG